MINDLEHKILEIKFIKYWKEVLFSGMYKDIPSFIERLELSGLALKNQVKNYKPFFTKEDYLEMIEKANKRANRWFYTSVIFNGICIGQIIGFYIL